MVSLVWYVWLGRFGLVGLVWKVWFGRFGLVGLTVQFLSRASFKISPQNAKSSFENIFDHQIHAEQSI